MAINIKKLFRNDKEDDSVNEYYSVTPEDA